MGLRKPAKPAEIGLQALEFPAHALELFGMGVAPRFYRRPLGQPCVALAQLDARFPRLTHQGEQRLLIFAES